MNTTYNLFPEEKLQVFNARYRPLQSDISEKNITLEDPWQKFLQSDETIPDEEPLFKESTEDITYVQDAPIQKDQKEPNVTQLHLGVGDQLLKGKSFFHAQDGAEGQYSDRPDPITIQHNVIKRANNYKSNKISQEIDNLDLSKEDKTYLKLLQYMEGGGDYKIENKYGFKGLYQFGKDALKTIGMDEEDYMQNPTNQHIAALKLKDFNLNKTGLRKYVGKVINGITLTENKLAVAQHAQGQKSVKRYIESNGTQIPVDRNNLPLTAYLAIF